MPTVLDQATAFKEFNDVIPAALSDALRPHVCGGHAELHRYTAAAEKAGIALGAYNPLADTTYAWPGKTTAAVVDLSYVQVWIDNAYLRVFRDLIGSGDTVAPVASYQNRIRAAATNWAANGATYPRAGALFDRDVRIGDAVHVVLDGSNELWTTVAALVAEVVAGSVGSAVANSANAGVHSSTAVAVQAGGASNYVALVNGDLDHTNFDGSATGDLSDVYTITVTTGSTGGDATTARLSVTTASGRDNQSNVQPAAFAASFAIGTRKLFAAFSIDTGRTVDPATATSDFVVGQSWTVTVNQAWTVPVATAAGTYTDPASRDYSITVTRGGLYQVPVYVAAPTVAPTATATGGGATGGLLQAGVYRIKYTWVNAAGETTASPESATLTVGATNIPRVTIPALPANVTSAKIYLTAAGGATGTEFFYKSGVTTTTTDLTIATTSGANPPTRTTATYNIANPLPPQITIVSNGPADSSGPTSVTAAATPVAAGSKGATIAFSGTGLSAGDVYEIPATGQSAGAIKTLILANNLSAALQAATDLAVTVYIKKPSLALAQQRLSAPPAVNWTATTAHLVLKAGADAYDPTWTNGGAELAAPIEAGPDTGVYAHYRAWLPTYAGTIVDAPAGPCDAAAVTAALGPIDPDNPLALAVALALQNANGTLVRYSAMADPADLEEWADVLEMLVGLKDVYSLAPLSDDPAVLALYAAHIAARSPDAVGGEWRVVWFPLRPAASHAIVTPATTSNLATADATLGDDPDTSGTQYTYLLCTTTNGKFVTNGVAVGDVVRTQYTQDAYGTETWSEYPVAAVVNEDTLKLAAGPGAALSTPHRFEVWRNATREQIATALAAQITAAPNSRVRYVWPDQITAGDTAVSGYFLCAALAAYTGGIAPQQGLRTLALSGFAAPVTRSTTYLNNAQLNILRAAGCTVVTSDAAGNVYVSDALTGDQASLDVGLEQAVRNNDAMKYLVYNRVAQFFGKANVTQEALNKIQTEVQSAIQVAKNTLIDRVGTAVVDAAITTLRKHATIPNRVVLVVTASFNYPLDEAAVTIVL